MPGSKGNKNALKHGIYSRQLTQAENESLDQARPDALDEIACLRAHAMRVNAWLLEKGPEEYNESYFAAVHTLVALCIAIGTLLRTQAVVTGKSAEVETSLEEAILSTKERWIMA
ncbi:MAG: hypothetical protein WCE68_00620 [Anaerolineales bacterium]